jgi:uncharacterized protein (TIGR02145 family)
MKTKCFRKNTSVEAGVLVKRLLRLRLAMTALLLWPMVLAAQNGVIVSGLAVNAGTVTFNVSWNAATMPVALWSDSVWVFVDYNKAGKMERLPLSTGATLTTTSAPGVGKVIEETGNNKGVWVVGNARNAGSFSATVKLLTATATATGACVYASNYPPVGEYISTSEIAFTGTPMYDLVLEHSDGSTVIVQSGSTLLLPCDYTLMSFTDKTGAPGIMKCIPPATYTLSVSASSFCAGSEGVQFSLSGTEAGRKYQLYRNNSAVDGAVLTGEGSAATFAGLFNVAGTYIARTVAKSGYCETAMNGNLMITMIPAPIITLAAGSNIQRDSLLKPITPIIYTTNNANNINLNGSLPVGISGTWDSNTYTISGTPTAAGTYNYTLTTTNANNCTNVSMSGTLTILSKGMSQPQGSCTYTEPDVVSTFANFPNTYSASTYVTLTDERDNKNYPVVKIGGRWIMARNLNYQKDLTWQANSNRPTNSTSYPVTTLIGNFWCPGGYSATTATSTLASCDVWGALYSWETAMSYDGMGSWTENTTYCTAAANSTNCKFNHGRTSPGLGTGGRGICPSNWHVPTDFEWGVILDGMESGGGTAHQGASDRSDYGINAGSRGKSKCTAPSGTTSGNTYVNDTQESWYYSSTLGTDVYGFRVLPAGYRNYDGSNFANRGSLAYFWSSSASSSSYVWRRQFYYNSATVNHGVALPRSAGLSIRCIRDL